MNPCTKGLHTHTRTHTPLSLPKHQHRHIRAFSSSQHRPAISEKTTGRHELILLTLAQDSASKHSFFSFISASERNMCWRNGERERDERDRKKETTKRYKRKGKWKRSKEVKEKRDKRKGKRWRKGWKQEKARRYRSKGERRWHEKESRKKMLMFFLFSVFLCCR